MSVSLAEYLKPCCVVNLVSRDKESAVRELVHVAAASVDGLDPDRVLEMVFEREALITTRVGPAIGLPHARVPMASAAVLAVGRSRAGVDYGDDEGVPVRLVVLLLVSDREPELALSLLAALGRQLRTERLLETLLETDDPVQFVHLLDAGLPRGETPTSGMTLARTSLVLRHALGAASESEAAAVLVCVEAETELGPVLAVQWPCRLILAFQGGALPDPANRTQADIIRLPAPGRNRTDTIRLSLLMCVARRLVGRHDVVVSLSGPPQTGHLDTLVVTAAGEELGVLSEAWASDIAGDIHPAVLERLVEITESLSREGREGRPVGTTFVVGDHERVLAQSHQLLINPFRGYREEDLNVLDPRIEETIRELSAVDGAFIMRGDGVLLSAGTYLRPTTPGAPLPSGFGARHAAAAGITASSAALAIVISESSAIVTVFHDGRPIISLGKTTAG